ncbi:MAG: class I SAM-dependent methyltransferase [Candidatus Sumerlaeia bacterium]|nr:class I SAM-dependent methyltransferase [Candidatus Sumerlaeia bacterium]
MTRDAGNSLNYDLIGLSYSARRCADPRIVDALISNLRLGKGSLVADIGAGTGNYACALADLGMRVSAVEPSSIMRRQSRDHELVTWYEGVAEELPLAGESHAGVICVLAYHHFKSGRQAVREMNRVCPRGMIVILACDPSLAEQTWWLNEYFPDVWQQARSTCPTAKTILDDFAAAGRPAVSIPFLIPFDLQDCFAAAGWRRPAMYLDPQVRSCISSFACQEPELLAMGLDLLRADLESGRWYQKNSRLAALNEIDWGYRLIVSHPSASDHSRGWNPNPP